MTRRVAQLDLMLSYQEYYVNWLRIVQNWSTGLRNNVARQAQGEEMCTELLRKTREFLVFASSTFWQREENKEDSAYGQALFQTHMTRKRALFEASLWSGRAMEIAELM
jgi:hypothetical protein